MAEYLADNATLIVLAVTLAGWFLLFAFLVRLDRSITRLEQHTSTRKDT